MAHSINKPPLMLLVHRIPFPPNKGDKIRSYHLLQALNEKYSVRLGCFIDSADDWQHVDALAEQVDELKVLPLNPRSAKIKSLRALASGEALSLPYYRNKSMQQWADKQCVYGCEKAVIFSSTMAQYVMNKSGITVVADFVDVDSDKWAQYAESLRWPLSLVYQRESKRLLRFERKAAAKFTATAFVTEAETALFGKLAPETSDRLITVANGVDRNYFRRDTSLTNPYSDSGPVLVFTGAMDYWANVDAVVWFADKLWPKIHARVKNARFYIVGGNPSPAVVKLAEVAGIIVTGRVPDVRPYVQYAAVSVAPLRIARGVQNKVLEALALEKPVVMSPQAAEGLTSGYQKVSGVKVIETSLSKGWVDEVCNQLLDPLVSNEGAAYIQKYYDWQTNLHNLIEALGEPELHSKSEAE